MSGRTAQAAPQKAAGATVGTGLVSTGAEVQIVYTTGASVTLRRNADLPKDGLGPTRFAAATNSDWASNAPVDTGSA